MVVEIGQVHRPVGMNLVIIQKLAKDMSYAETAKGVMPFLASDFIRIGLFGRIPGPVAVAGAVDVMCHPFTE